MSDSVLSSKSPCFGLQWDGTDGDCKKCVISDRCRQRMEKRSGSNPVAVAPQPANGEDPLEYLVGKLREKFTFDRKENEGAIAYYFFLNDSLRVLILHSKSSGRIKIISHNPERSMTLGKLSMGSADRILVEIG